MSLRLRLTAIYVFLLAISLAGFALAGYLIAARRIYQGVDDLARATAGEIIGDMGTIAAPLSPPDVAAFRDKLDAEASLGTTFELRDPAGNVLYSSLGSAERTLPGVTGAHASESRTLTKTVQGRRLRLLYQPIISNGQFVGSLEVGQPLRPTDRALGEIRYIFIAGGVGALLVTSVSAYVLAGRALDPVRQVSRLARDIERTADFSRRVPATRLRDEMGELTATFNRLIGRVERVLITQRDFLADSSHELRRPLTVLRTNIDVLKTPGLAPEERAACLREMGAEAEAMSRLISDLLLLARDQAQAIQFTPLDLSALCEQAVARLRSIDSEHKLAAEVTPAVRIAGDRERLAQMLWNILENAREYTPGGGSIELRLGRSNGVARIEVKDTGVGMGPEDLSQVFRRFYRSEQARAMRAEGIGLGLAIVRYVAEAHGGSVAIESDPGKGSRVIVDLPVPS